MHLRGLHYSSEQSIAASGQHYSTHRISMSTDYTTHPTGILFLLDDISSFSRYFIQLDHAIPSNQVVRLVRYTIPPNRICFQIGHTNPPNLLFFVMDFAVLPKKVFPFVTNIRLGKVIWPIWKDVRIGRIIWFERDAIPLKGILCSLALDSRQGRWEMSSI